MLEKKLIFVVFVFLAKIVAHPFFDERSEKLTALKVAEEPEEAPEEVQTEEESNPEATQEEGSNEVAVTATLGPDSDTVLRFPAKTV